jgi:hypothetical protein
MDSFCGNQEPVPGLELEQPRRLVKVGSLRISLLLMVQVSLLGCADPLSDSRGMLAERLPGGSNLSSPPTPLEFIDKLKFLEGNN